MKQLYVSLVRCHLEYAVSVWNPYLKGDVERIERVQHRVTWLLPELKVLPYGERLEKLGLTKHELRRERGDLIQYHKIRLGKDIVDWFHEPEVIGPGGVGYSLRSDPRVRGQVVRGCEQRNRFFTNRVVNAYNELPAGAKDAQTVNQFKAALARVDRFR